MNTPNNIWNKKYVSIRLDPEIPLTAIERYSGVRSSDSRFSCHCSIVVAAVIVIVSKKTTTYFKCKYHMTSSIF